MSKQLIEILCCPVTHKPLVKPSASALAALNRAIEAGEIERQSGEMQSEPLDEALFTEDKRLAYRFDDGIAVLLEEEAIVLSQLDT